MVVSIKELWDNVTDYPYKEKAKELILETSIEIAIGGMLGPATFGGMSYAHERAKLGSIPIGYTNFHHSLYNKSVLRPRANALTRCYASTNDVVMQIFESNNDAYRAFFLNSLFKIDHEFGKQVERKVEKDMRIYPLITDYAGKIDAECGEAMTTLKPLSNANKDLAPVIDALENSWDDSHHDVYRTETYISTCSAGNGKTRPCVKTRQVYDHTNHHYVYYPEEGERADRALDKYAVRNPDIRIREKLQLPPDQTEADNEFAMRQSRKGSMKNKEFTPEFYAKSANMWATGSNYVTLLPHAYSNHARLIQDVPQWHYAKRTAQSISYSTHSRLDSGPEEFQIAERALEHARNTSSPIAETVNGIAYARTGIPKLSSLAVTFSKVTMHNEKGGKPSVLADELLENARTLYEHNFSGGFDTRPAKWFMVFVWSFVGLMLGCGAGYGADCLIEQKFGRNYVPNLRNAYRRN